jgi:hypothetical protein
MGFARSSRGIEYALVQDAPGGPTTASEIHNMGRWDRYLTAMLRARWYREKNKSAKRAQNQK